MTLETVALYQQQNQRKTQEITVFSECWERAIPGTDLPAWKARLFSPLLINTLFQTYVSPEYRQKTPPHWPAINLHFPRELPGHQIPPGITSQTSALTPHLVQSGPILSQVEKRATGEINQSQFPPFLNYSPVCAFQYSNRTTSHSTGE